MNEDPTVAQDPSARPPSPPPDDPNEPDVTKRGRFLYELGRQRVGWGCPFRIDTLKDAEKDIPEARKRKLLENWSGLLAPDLKPPRAGMIRWYARWGDYSNIGLMIDLIVGEWPARGATVRASQLADTDSHVNFLVRLPQRPQLQFRHRPRDTEVADAVDYINWEFVPTAEVRNLLMELFHWPDPADALFWVHGQMQTCAGVDVFAGSFRVPRAGERVAQGGTVPEDKVPAGPVPERILITDSDPQYVCLSFDLGEEAPQGQQP